MKRMAIWACILTFCIGLCSCEHKDLCIHHPHTAKVRIDVDWSEFVEEQPTGMTVMIYPLNGTAPQTLVSNTLNQVYANMEAGFYHTLVYNQSPSEFGSVMFRNMDNYREAEVVSNTHNSRWYQGRSENERVAAQPEWIGTDFQQNAEVTQQMVDETMGMIEHETRAFQEYVIARHTPRNIVYTVHVKVNVTGVYNLRSARAALDGMAEGYRFASALPTEAKATYLIENWKMTAHPIDPTRGYITATFYCFGLPQNHRKQATENELMLSLLLVDNQTQLDYAFAVGDKFERKEEGRLELFLELDLPEVLPDVKPEGGSAGGFDVVVDDWGDEKEQDVPF